MSVEQVKATVPGVAVPEKPDFLNSGAEELLRLENIEIVNKTFSAKFYFISEKLTQVTLTLERRLTFDSTMLVFESLTDALRVKYGQEISRDIKRSTIINIARANWLAGRTNISVFAMGVKSSDATLNVNYQVRLARDADKL
jgi:hypothetical protein